jgi:N-acetylneuraminate lyase
MKNISLTGLIAATFTPFKSDFRLDLDAVPKIAAHLARQNVAGAFIAGVTGEWASLKEEERRVLADTWRRAAGRELTLIVHVGHNSLVASRDLARHAESIGADAIAALMPSFFRPATIASVVDFCRMIAEVAPNTPFYYYHIPDMTGVNFKMAEFLPKARASIPTFRGVKFAHSDLMDFGLSVAIAGDREEVLFGCDEILLAGLAMGAKGAIGSTYGYAANIYHKLIKAYESNSAAECRSQQLYILRTIVPLLRFGGIAGGKAIMAMVGSDCGPPRPPLERLSSEQTAALRSELDQLDFFTAIAANPGRASRD